MPITQLSQAQIVFSKAQAKALGELAESLPDSVVSITVEDTNIPNALAIITRRGTSMMNFKGNIVAFDKRGA